MINCSFASCTPAINSRKLSRIPGTDGRVKEKLSLTILIIYFLCIAAQPGYFTSTLSNGVKIETTSTRRAGLIQFTFQNATNATHVVVDLTNDLQRSFQGGSLTFNSTTSRVQLGGTYLQAILF